MFEKIGSLLSSFSALVFIRKQLVAWIACRFAPLVQLQGHQHLCRHTL